MLQLGLADDCCRAIHMQLAMMQSALCAYNAKWPTRASSVKGMLVEIPNTRKATQVGIVNHSSLTAWKPKAFNLLNHLHHSAAQDQQYKIVLHASQIQTVQ